jgi:hypothetical protein
MKKTLTLIAAGLLALTASCTYNTSSSDSKGVNVPIVQPVVRPVYYYSPVIEPPMPPIIRRSVTYTYTPYGVYCE